MQNSFSRTQLLLGKDSMKTLEDSRVLLFGLGGVGGNCAEALVRSGLGAIDLVDDDRICLTNLNRQLFATRKSIGQYKVDAAKERLLSINPDLKIQTHQCFYLPETAGDFDFSSYDYIIDCIDTVTAKIDIILRAKEAGIPIISCMGTGNKLDPTKLQVADIYQTTMCPLAKVMRHELKKRHVRKLKVVFSTEKPTMPIDDPSISCRLHCVCPPGTARKCTDRRDIPGSTSFVPPAAGLIIAGEVIRDITGVKPQK